MGWLGFQSGYICSKLLRDGQDVCRHGWALLDIVGKEVCVILSFQTQYWPLQNEILPLAKLLPKRERHHTYAHTHNKPLDQIYSSQQYQ